jgi:hypothetical protein
MVWVGAPRKIPLVNSPKIFEDSIPPRITSDKKRRKLKKRDSCYVLLLALINLPTLFPRFY